MNKRVCIFCGANTGNTTNFKSEAIKLCELLIANDYDLVYGGGETGLMGVIADQFLKAGKAVIGVRPSRLIIDEKARENLTELIVVDSMAERKLKMIELSDYFIALPGGIGTLDEIIETFTLQKIGFIAKPSGILNTDDYYAGLIRMLDKMINSGFLNDYSLAGLKIASRPSELLRKMNMVPD